MLEQKQFEAMKYLWETRNGVTFCHDLEEAKQFCWRMKLRDDNSTIIHDIKAARYYIVNEADPILRNFEQQYRIHETEAA